MAGAADLVAALTGGDKLERDAYSQAAQRIASAQAAQSLMDKRVQEAYALRRQNEARDRFGRVFSSVVTNRPEGQIALSNNELATLVPEMLSGGYGTANDALSALETLNQALGRQATVAGAQQMNYRPDVVGALAFDPKQAADIGTVEKVGDLLLTGNRSENPQVEAIMTALNAKTAAASDKSGSKGVRGDRIADYLRLGIPERDAIALADSKARLEANPKTGRMVFINELDGTTYEVPIQGGTSTTPIPTPGPGQSLYDLAPEATGIGATAQDLFSRGVTLFGASADMEPTMAIQTINTAKNEMIRALSINPRFPVGEIERLAREINIAPGLLTSSDSLQARMRSVDSSLRLRLAQAERDAGNPRLSDEIRQSQSDNAVAIRNFLAQLGVPQERKAITITPEWRTKAEQALIDVPGFVDDLSPEEQERLIEHWIRQQQEGANVQ